MKKFTAISLALSLGLACLGNQVNATSSNGLPEPVGTEFAQAFNLPIDDEDAGYASALFQNIIVYKLILGNNEEVARQFANFSNFVKNMSENSRKYLGAVILSCPVISGFNESISEDIKARMIGSFLVSIYNNLNSIEWNIDVKNCKGTANLYMRRIPDDIRVIIGLHSEFIHIHENKISFSF